jgi:hypothetical protein
MSKNWIIFIVNYMGNLRFRYFIIDGDYTHLHEITIDSTAVNIGIVPNEDDFKHDDTMSQQIELSNLLFDENSKIDGYFRYESLDYNDFIKDMIPSKLIIAEIHY